MDHTYQNIPGWFDFQDLYAEAVERAHDGAVFVEVGAFVGKSLTFLATEIVNSMKKITLVSVDSMRVVPTFSLHPNDKDANDAHGLYGGEYLSSVLASHLTSHVKAGLRWAHRCRLSEIEADEHDDASLDFVFIDADHNYGAVRADIEAWWPKVKPGGRLAGHDHIAFFPGVEQACKAVFGQGYRVQGSSWVKDK